MYKISSLFKINKKRTTEVSDFLIGKNHFVKIKVLNKKIYVLKDKTIKYLLSSELEVYWFSNEYQFESSLNLITSNNSNTIFVIVG